MRLSVPQELFTLAALWKQNGATAYAVGGMVRNALLGLPPADFDMASALSPMAVIALCKKNDIRVIEKAVDMGTVEIHIGSVSVEHTTFRSEEYDRGGKHRPSRVTVGAGLEADAFRRDFTVNALYYDLTNDAFLDPTGGRDDLTRRILRTTSKDPERILQDDALRILRMVRFACQLGFTIDPATWAAAAKNVDQLFDIAPERRRDELNKMLLCDVRYPALPSGKERSVYRALSLLTALGAWDSLIPELNAGRDMAQRPDFHRYTVTEHAFHTCQAAEPVLPLRLAGLLHDVGKPAAFLRDGNFHLHDVVGEKITLDALGRLRYPNAVRDRVANIVRYHMYDIQGQAKDATLRVRFATWGRELTKDVIAIRRADIRGTGTGDGYEPVRWQTLFDKMQQDGTPFSESELAITGRDIMEIAGIPAGERVGQIKRKLFLHCARHPKDNTKEKLCRICRDLS